jgi:small subunit ribosomal protein S25e
VNSLLKKRSLKQIEKQQRMQSQKKEERTRSRSRTSADKIIRGLSIPKVNDKSLKSDLSKMGAITPYSIASKYGLRLSLAKDFLEVLEKRGSIRAVEGNSRIKVYRLMTD